jgi:hypothetical protein
MIFVGAAVLAAHDATADSRDRVLMILNHTRSEMRELYTSPAGQPAWGADQLGSMSIAVGGNVKVNLHNTADACVFDVMMVFADGEKVVRRENVCGSGTLVVTEHREPELPST